MKINQKLTASLCLIVASILVLSGCQIQTSIPQPVAETAPPTATAAPPPTTSQLPIFDTHVHYSQDAWSVYAPSEIIQKFVNSDVIKALVASSPDDGTRMLYEIAPEMIVPFLRPYGGEANSSNWYLVDGIFEYLQGRLETHPYAGIGEFHLHSTANVNLPSVQNTIREAVARDIYLFIHSDAAEVEAVFNFEPNAKIFWGHAGMSEPPEVVSAMMDQYPNLWTDLSYREHQIIAANGQIDPAWLALLVRHQDRITVGSDTWVTPRWGGYEQIIADHRLYLEQLPQDVAKKIAFANAERLFGAAIE